MAVCYHGDTPDSTGKELPGRQQRLNAKLSGPARKFVGALVTPAKSSTATFGSGTDQVDRVESEVPQNRCRRLTEASPCENGGERDQIVVRMTHRHFAIFRTRVKPYRAYNSSGPVCR